jgi:2-keto-4-pentenoate hydratase/2-oxohepta-3-ene-1,7-dioic acid hydratase in catechol pathway
MRLANRAGRATIVTPDQQAIDVAEASSGRFGPDPSAVYERWDEFRSWAAETDLTPTSDRIVPAELGPPSPTPRQVFAIGLNYRRHAEESGMALPTIPAVFTKYPTCIVAGGADVVLTGDSVDWEVELVVVIGAGGRSIAETDAWHHVAGLCVGQDISDRVVQFAAGAQFSLGKSARTFGPTGPWLVTPDEFDDPNDLAISCAIDGEVMQADRTGDLVFDIASLIAQISAVVELLPGDLIFTGTPSGVGIARQPARFLKAGEVLESTIEGIGTIHNRIVPAESAAETAPTPAS